MGAEYMSLFIRVVILRFVMVICNVFCRTQGRGIIQICFFKVVMLVMMMLM
jgi:hypothetical protein